MTANARMVESIYEELSEISEGTVFLENGFVIPLDMHLAFRAYGRKGEFAFINLADDGAKDLSLFSNKSMMAAISGRYQDCSKDRLIYRGKLRSSIGLRVVEFKCSPSEKSDERALIRLYKCALTL